MITSDETTNPIEHHLVVKRSIFFFTVAFSVQFYSSMLQNTVVGMCGLCGAGVLYSEANGWGLQKRVVLLTTAKRPNYHLKS